MSGASLLCSALVGRALAAVVVILLGTLTAIPRPAAGTDEAVGLAATGVGQAGSWIVDSTGRVVVLHGLNQVFKMPPYEPASDGFGDDDAAFLAENGFDTVRVGVIRAAVEPAPGRYDDAELDSIGTS